MFARSVRHLYQRLTLVGLLSALALALIACAGGEEEGPATPTGTPGATATPAAAASPAATAAPTEVAIPAQPRNFADYPTTIAAYLTEAQGSPSCLSELLRTWDMPEATTPSPEHCGIGDTDGDGEDEYVVLITDPDSAGSMYAPFSGDVVIFDKQGQRYVPAYQASDTLALTMIGPALVGVDDYNGDGLTEAVLTSGDCGAHTCFTDVVMLGWDGSDYVDLFAGSLGVPWTRPDEITFWDIEGDGVQEVYLPAGAIGSIGAGPQRESFLTYAWDGSHYVLAKEELAGYEHLYFAVTEGDEAYAKGHIEEAIANYIRAIEDPTLYDWKEDFGSPGGRFELVPYAQFRLYLAQLSTLAADETVQAQELVDSISGLVNDYPESLHAQAAREFAIAYPDGEVSAAALATGCAAFLPFVEEKGAKFDVIWDYGYANPELVPEELCPH